MNSKPLAAPLGQPAKTICSHSWRWLEKFGCYECRKCRIRQTVEVAAPLPEPTISTREFLYDFLVLPYHERLNLLHKHGIEGTAGPEQSEQDFTTDSLRTLKARGNMDALKADTLALTEMRKAEGWDNRPPRKSNKTVSPLPEIASAVELRDFEVKSGQCVDLDHDHCDSSTKCWCACHASKEFAKWWMQQRANEVPDPLYQKTPSLMKQKAKDLTWEAWKACYRLMLPTPAPVPLGEPAQTFEEIVKRVLITPINREIGGKCGTSKAIGFARGWHFAIKRFKEEFAALATKAVPIGEGELPKRPERLKPMITGKRVQTIQYGIKAASEYTDGMEAYADALEAELLRLRSQEGPRG